MEDLINDLGVEKLHAKNITSYANKYKASLKEFNDFVGSNKLSIYSDLFSHYNVFVLKDLRNILIQDENMFQNNEDNNQSYQTGKTGKSDNKIYDDLGLKYHSRF